VGEERRIADSWLREYLRYTSGQESPEMFHLWVAFTLVACVVERKVWLERGYSKLFPNLYTILVAGSAVCRKTTATDIGIDLLKDLDNAPEVFAQKITPEALIDQMCPRATMEDGKISVNSTAMLYAPELSVFLSSAAISNGIIPLLTSLYDSKSVFDYQTKGGGKQVLHNVYVNILGASTPTWLKSTIPTDAVGGGFMSRCVFAYAERPKAMIAFPHFTDEIVRHRNNLLHDLAIIRDLKGEMHLTPEAHAWYEQWYAEEVARLVEEPNSEFLVRRTDIALKVAMLVSLCETNAMEITVEHLQVAIGALDAVRETMTFVVDPITMAKESEITAKILNVITRHEGILYADLLRKCWRFAKKDAVMEAIDTLIEGHLVESSPVGKTRAFRARGEPK
jgi:hypothetical protein